jgi:outer membrane protein assembly factor BamB
MRSHPHPLPLAVLVATLPVTLAAAEPASPQWRGPAGDGHAPAAHDLPVTWSETHNVAWKTPLEGRGWSSPVIGDGRIWMTTAVEREANPEERARALEGNRMAGQLAVSGEPVWSERLGGNFSSSPLFADGRIYVGNRDGDTFVIEPGRTYELLATNHLDGSVYATPAAAGRAIFLRTETALYRIEKPQESRP